MFFIFTQQKGAYYRSLFYPKVHQHLPIDVQANSRGLGRADCAVLIQLYRIFKRLIDFSIILGRIEFRYGCVGYRTVQMDMYLLLAMGAQYDAIGIRHCSNL